MPPLPCSPTKLLGHTGAAPAPRPTPPVTDAKVLHCAFRALLKRNVVPEPSLRTTTVIGRLLNVTPGFAAAIVGSFQFVMVPVKMPQSAAVERRSAWPLGRPVPAGLYAAATDVETSGMTSAAPKRCESVPVPLIVFT